MPLKNKNQHPKNSQLLQVSRNKVVFLDLLVLDTHGKTIETTGGKEPFSYIHGRGNLLPALEFYLEGQCSGFECDIILEPEDAFGKYQTELILEVKRDQLSADVLVKEGEYVQAHGPNGVMQFRIDHIGDIGVRLNANHPLAGKKLTFLLKVLSVREPHGDEVRHKRPHPAGHHLMVTGSV